MRVLQEKLHRWFTESSKWVAWVGVPRLVGGALAVAVGAVALVLIVRVPAPPIESTIPQAGVTTSVITSAVTSKTAVTSTVNPQASLTSPPTSISVHVVGAVRHEGVYVLAPGSRADDALRAAGGAMRGADTAAVNLAAIIRDGDQLFIPTRRAAAAAPPRRHQVMSPSTRATSTTSSSVSPDASGSRGQPSGVVSLSTATQQELESLPGVGPATASAIVAHRRTHGPFRRVDDLLNVKGIGESKLAAMRSRIVP